MNLAKALKLSANIMMHSKLRSWLTIIGIVIGVAAVVAIVSIGNGLQQSVKDRLNAFGADQITISPGSTRAGGTFRFAGGGGGGVSATTAKNLTQKDIQVIKTTPGVKFVDGMVSGQADVYYLSQSVKLSVQGVDPLAWQQLTSDTLAQGRFLTPADAYSVVVGSNVAASVFKQQIPLNQNIQIEGQTFRVVGILASTGDGGADNQIIMPISVARKVVPNIGNEQFNSILLSVNDVAQVNNITAALTARLSAERNVIGRNVDFRITSAQSLQSRISSITGTLTAFLAAIAAVSLLVGAVGIMNTMFTSVLEKTKDIGIMKAIGASNHDILLIFVFNSALVGFVGGLLGVLFGVGASVLIPVIGLRLIGPGGGGSTPTVVTPDLLIGALVVSVLIGVIAGIIPAYRASRLRPVDALRYE